jgi:hypothetical protein
VVAEGERLSKRERREARQHAASQQRRRRLLLRVGIAALVVLPVVLWQVDRTGAEERVTAEVVEVRVWRHYPARGRSHTHQAATLEIEGLTRATLERADDLQRGQRLPVRIRRGRLSGRAYFVARDDGAPAQDAEE